MKTQERNKKSKAKNPFSNWNGIPATVKWSISETSLYESFAASIIWHIIGILLLWLITFAITFFGITPKLFPTPKHKIQDIHFVLKTPYSHKVKHSSVNQQQLSASKVDYHVKPVAPAPPASAPKKTVTNIIPQIKPTIQKHTTVKNILPSNNTKTSTVHKTSSRVSGKVHSNVEVPALPMSMSKLKSMSSGLGSTGTGRRSASGAGFSASSYGSVGTAASSGSGSSGFDKTTAKKMITTYDISPYVNELKRNIRWNWKAPKGYENKRVELFLRVAKDGRLIILNVKKTSEVGEVDNAALNAVRRCLPLNPLPSKYSKNYLDLVFTFGANSVGSRY